MAKARNDDNGSDKFRLARTIIAIPLLEEIKEKKKTGDKYDRRIRVIIDLNLRFTGEGAEIGKKRAEASKRVRRLLEDIKKDFPQYASSSIDENSTQYNQQYIFATLHPEVIEELVRRDGEVAKEVAGNRGIYHIWPDFKVKAFTTKSISTVKADAAHASFSAVGRGVTWAVIDSGIDRKHKHFKLHDNIHKDETFHHDFTGGDDPFDDTFGHGTHVAGIIAGELTSEKEISSITAVRDEHGEIHYKSTKFNRITGMAPCCTLVSLKVLDDEGYGHASSLIAAISAIQDINGYGRDIKIHGVNLSLGYEFEPEWFACGQSPLCVEVDRLVRSGVVVVAAAGNTGYGTTETEFRGHVSTGLPFSINDPGNAELAITVGSTHRDMPHTYGVSYFSSKGPTGDGRIKPDLVAPGEKITSCATGNKKRLAQEQSGIKADYTEDSGTSMAAPHVSGVIAAFLSVRQEFIGKPELVKSIFTANATDLKRDRYFQGNGLIDLMRAIQSV